ncbi:MAG: hypothetical protein M3Q08_12935 [Pseudomonadota bacterium]|jgi:hypothetical protein|nr:hypothetical protein [Pseudomonadota bacterium]
MSYYRLYVMNRSSGHIESFDEIEAADDAEAVRLAARQAGTQPLELWCRNRKVRRFETERTLTRAGE